jgi:hypothetical protein
LKTRHILVNKLLKIYDTVINNEKIHSKTVTPLFIDEDQLRNTSLIPIAQID